jgi:hypothetical protein
LGGLDSLRAARTDRESREIIRQTRHAVDRAHGRALESSAKLEGGAYAARTALMNTALLSKDEESYVQLAPLGEARYKAIVDAYTIFAAGEVGRL